MTSLWDMVQELIEVANEGELHHREEDYVCDLFDNLDPHNPYEELTEQQIRYIFFLYDKYCNGKEVEWDDYESD